MTNLLIISDLKRERPISLDSIASREAGRKIIVVGLSPRMSTGVHGVGGDFFRSGWD